MLACNSILTEELNIRNTIVDWAGLILFGETKPKERRRKEADVVHPLKMARSLTALSTSPPARLMAPIDRTLRGSELLRLPLESLLNELKPKFWHGTEKKTRDLGVSSG